MKIQIDQEEPRQGYDPNGDLLIRQADERWHLPECGYPEACECWGSTEQLFTIATVVDQEELARQLETMGDSIVERLRG